MSSGGRRDQFGLGVDLSHLKSSIWDQRSAGDWKGYFAGGSDCWVVVLVMEFGSVEVERVVAFVVSRRGGAAIGVTC